MTYAPTKREREYLMSPQRRARQQARNQLKAMLAILTGLLFAAICIAMVSYVLTAFGAVRVSTTEPTDVYVDGDGRTYTHVQANGAMVALQEFCAQAIADSPEGLGDGDLGDVCGKYQ